MDTARAASKARRLKKQKRAGRKKIRATLLRKLYRERTKKVDRIIPNPYTDAVSATRLNGKTVIRVPLKAKRAGLLGDESVSRSFPCQCSCQNGRPVQRISNTDIIVCPRATHIICSRQLANRATSKNGGFPYAQLNTVGLARPKKGWLKALIKAPIPVEQAVNFLNFHRAVVIRAAAPIPPERRR